MSVSPIINRRLFAVPAERLFCTFSDANQLALWWGPHGFSNRFHQFEFRPEGQWQLDMIGPDGTAHPNTSVFKEIVPPSRIVFEHLDQTHWYQMVITMEPAPGGTEMTWRMRFATSEETERLRSFIERANEENFDRLEAVLETNPDSKKV